MAAMIFRLISTWIIFQCRESGEHTLYVPMHWHPEVEFHYQLQGSVRIQVELTEYVLHPGEVLWINAKQLHDCHPVGNETAVSHTIIFHPAFIYGTESNVLFRKYVKPLLGNPATPALYIRPEDPEQQILLHILYKCGILHQEQSGNLGIADSLPSFRCLGTSLENESAILALRSLPAKKYPETEKHWIRFLLIFTLIIPVKYL